MDHQTPRIVMLCKQAIHRILQCFGSRDIELSIRCKIQYIKTEDIDQATVAHVVPPPHCGEDALCLLQREVHDADSIFFMFQQIKYSLRSDCNQFVELDFPTDLPIAHYIDANTLTDDDAEELKLKYGSNEFNIPMPQFWEIFQEHATAPFFLFQIFCVGLWCLDEYWMYSLFTLFMLVMFEMMMVKRRMGNMKMIRNMRTKPFLIYVGIQYFLSSSIQVIQREKS